jgi:AcrR family transcriptional regulator
MSKKRRVYALKARGERMAETRARIVEATVALHEELGPRRTTVSAIADRAGVERLTVYRHFPDERAILAACSSCWVERNPPPDPAGWSGTADPVERTGKAMLLLYRYYSRTQGMLGKVLHDAEDMPAVARASAGMEAYVRGVADDLFAAWKMPAAGRSALRALLRHAVRFSTWASLDSEGLSDPAKARLVVTCVAAAAAAKQDALVTT